MTFTKWFRRSRRRSAVGAVPEDASPAGASSPSFVLFEPGVSRARVNQPMKSLSRRKFINDSSLAMAGVAWSGAGFVKKKKAPLLSFSTLGCPKWPLPDILSFAAEHGYQGVELRGILGELDLTKCREFSSENIASTKKRVEDKQLRIVNLGSSAALHHANGEKRRVNLDDAKRFIHLAQQLGCPHVRVFPDAPPAELDRGETIDLVSAGLVDLAAFAKGSGVDVLLESHGAFVETGDLLQIMRNSERPQVGMVWDVVNMWSVTKEPPIQVYEQLGKYIRHTHIKDARLTNGELRYVLLGQGDAPIREAVKALVRGKYEGFYCFEWEKLWHPDIEEPEIALAHYPKEMRTYF